MQRPQAADDMVKTADEIYVRFHGPERWYRHNYSGRELAEWAARIQASGAGRVWADFNNDYDTHAIPNTEVLREMLDLQTK